MKLKMRRSLRRARTATPRWIVAPLAIVALLIGGAVSAMAAAHPAPLHGHMAATVDQTKLESVTKRLMCMCGCNLTVLACEGAMTCEVAARMKDEARQKLSSGLTPALALTSFAKDYGERVLAEPTKKGFNLTAWILPFAGLALGGALVGISLRHWRPRARLGAAPAPDIDPTYAALIEDEIRQGM